MEQLLIKAAIGIIVGVIQSVRESKEHSDAEKKAILDSISDQLDATAIRVEGVPVRDV